MPGPGYEQVWAAVDGDLGGLIRGERTNTVPKLGWSRRNTPVESEPDKGGAGMHPLS
jgi:hypothetical protein